MNEYDYLTRIGLQLDSPMIQHEVEKANQLAGKIASEKKSSAETSSAKSTRVESVKKEKGVERSPMESTEA